MAVDFRVGKDAKLYYDSGSDYSSPTWVLIPRTADLSVDMSKNEADLSTRESSFALVGTGMKVVGLEFGYLHPYLVADTVFDALNDSYFNDTPIQMLILDGLVATSNAHGLRAFFVTMGMPQDQALEAGIKFTFSMKPTRWDDSGTLRPPEWHTVS